MEVTPNHLYGYRFVFRTATNTLKIKKKKIKKSFSNGETPTYLKVWKVAYSMRYTSTTQEFQFSRQDTSPSKPGAACWTKS